MNAWRCPVCGATGRETNAGDAMNAGIAHFYGEHPDEAPATTEVTV